MFPRTVANTHGRLSPIRNDHLRLYMHRAVCGIDYAWHQARGEPKRVPQAREGEACGHEIFVN